MRVAALVLILLAGCATRGRTDFSEQYEQGRALLNKGDFQRAGELARRAAEEARRRGSAEWKAAFAVMDGEALAYEHRHEREAIRKLEDIAPPPARPDVAARRNGILAMEICTLAHDLEPPAAQEQFRRADALLGEAARAAAQAGAQVQGELKLQEVSCLIDKEQLGAAEAAVRGVLDLARASHLRSIEGNAWVYLSYLRSRGGPAEEGVQYSKQSLAIAGEIESGRMLVKSLGNLGLFYTRLGDYDNALDYLKQGESLAVERQFVEDDRNLLQNIGNVNYFIGDFSAAAEYYDRALPLTSSRRLKAQLNANLSAVAIERRDLEAAGRFNAEALRLKRELQDPDSLRRSEVLNARIVAQKGQPAAAEAEFRRLARAGGPEDVLVESHAGLAEICRKLGRNREAEREYRRAISIVESSRDALKLDDSKITYLSGVSELYDNYIGYLAGEGRVREALAAADQSRAATLAQRTEQTDDRATREQAPDTPSLAKSRRSVLLSYWLAEAGSFLWVSTPSGVEQFRLPPRADIERRVEAYQRIVEKPHGDVLRSAADQGVELWRMLIGPAEKLIPRDARVIIVPDRGLHRLNFETLVSPSPVPHYWIEDVTVAEAPALRVLQASARTPQRDSILLMGNPAEADRDFPPLHYSAAEISGIEQLYPPADRIVLTGASATPAAYLGSGPRRFRFIHFAAHATANRIRPLDSAVVFARAGGEYKLFARDVLRAPLEAELVTISGCRSAGARAYAGEGLVGFTWAFLRAGARNVIAGLWDVDDESTAQLMVQLHHELRQGHPPADALRTAKLALLRKGIYGRPFYWAPFLLYTRAG